MASVSCPACFALVPSPGSPGYRGFATCPRCGHRFLASFEEPAAVDPGAKLKETQAIPQDVLDQLMEDDLSDATRESTLTGKTVEGEDVRGELRMLETNQVFSLEKFKFEIGREGPDLVINDPTVSRQHAVIENHAPRFLLKDLGSRNGTFLNGKRITVEFLESGDVVQAGKVKLRFELRRV